MAGRASVHLLLLVGMGGPVARGTEGGGRGARWKDPTRSIVGRVLLAEQISLSFPPRR